MPKTIKPMQTHVVERTTPKGGPFRGRCTLCGAENLTLKSALDACGNPRRVGREDALLDSLTGGESPQR